MTTPTTTEHQTLGVPADTFANRLILARAQAGHLSIREAADKCGIGRGAWTNWEKGAQPADYDELVDVIATELECDPCWLRDGGPLAPAPPRRPRWQRESRPHRHATLPYLSRPPVRHDSTRPAPKSPTVHHPRKHPGRTSRVAP